MARGSKNGKRKRTSLAMRVGALAFALYLVGTIVNLQLMLSDRRGVLEEATSQYQELDITNRELGRMLHSGSDKDYARRVAREKLGLAYSDEQVYRYQ